MTFLNRVWAIAAKDLRAELRTKQMSSAMLIFAFLVIVIFAFAFDPTRQSLSFILPGVIWVAFFFAALLGLNRSFVGERVNDCLHGLMLAPVDRSAIYFGKVLANLIFTLVVEAIALPLFFVLFNYSLQGSWGVLLAIVALGTFGFIAVGTFLAALAANTRTSEILLPVILFPVAVPVVIGAVQATRAVLAGAPLADFLPWFGVLGVYGVVFLAVPFLLFEYVLEG
ncbi:MAG TPA: heme exporter protein CcmB [Firmicutes bacterium]|nr:heme exporter protein CcmB [Bacillota bacterium]